MKKWPFIFNFLMFAAFATFAPVMVLFYQGLGFSGTQIGILAGLTPLITIISIPMWTRVADATRKHSLILGGALLTGVLALALLPLLKTFALVLLVGAVYMVVAAPVTSLVDNATMVMLGDEKELYGRVRLGGTIGFGIAAAIAGVLVERYGLKLAFWAAAILLFAAFAASRKLVFRHEDDEKEEDETETSDDSGSIGALLVQPKWRLFLLLAFAGGLHMVISSAYLYPYMEGLGMRESVMGFALTVGTIVEIPILFWGDRLIRRFKPWGFFLIANLVSGLRLLLFGVVSAPWLVMAIQLTNGLAFPAMWVAGVSFADEHAPPEMGATAQGLFGAMVMGLGNAVGGFAGGLLLGAIGGSNLFLIIGAVIFMITVLGGLRYNSLAK